MGGHAGLQTRGKDNGKEERKKEKNRNESLKTSNSRLWILGLPSTVESRLSSIGVICVLGVSPH